MLIFTEFVICIVLSVTIALTYRIKLKQLQPDPINEYMYKLSNLNGVDIIIQSRFKEYDLKCETKL